MIMRRGLTIIACLLIFFDTSSAQGQVPQFTVEVLQTPSTGGVAYDVNDVGMIVGHVYDHGTYAVMWNGKKVTTLARVASATFGQGERPVGVNRAGIGFFNDGAHGFVFNAKSLAAGFRVIENAALAAINDVGQIAGTVSRVATLWDKDLVKQLPSQSAALGLNNFAVVTGFVDLGNATAIRWREEGDVQSIEVLPSLPDGGSSSGYAVDDFGNVVGVGYVNGAQRAVAWLASGPTVLAALPDSVSSRAWDLNIDQWIVGEDSRAGGGARATLWVDGSAFDLSALVVGPNPFQRLATAFGINDRGEIVGAGSVEGVITPFILRPKKGNRVR